LFDRIIIREGIMKSTVRIVRFSLFLIFFYGSPQAGSKFWNYSPTLINSTGFNGNPGTLAVGDVDGNGMSDLLMIEAGAFVFYKNIGNGEIPIYVMKPEWGIPWDYPYSACPYWPTLADLDGDGRCELFFWTHVYRNIHMEGGIEWEEADSTFHVAPYNHSGYGFVYGFVDIDADGDLDGYGFRDGRTGFALNDGNRFRPVWSGRFLPITAGPEPFRGLRLGDFDGDADPDMLLTYELPMDAGWAEWYELHFSGDSATCEPRGRVVSGIADMDLAMGDVNGNGKPDLLTADWANGVEWFEKTEGSAVPVFRQRLDGPKGYRETGVCVTRGPENEKPRLHLMHPVLPSDVWEGRMEMHEYRWTGGTGYQESEFVSLYFGGYDEWYRDDRRRFHLRPAFHARARFEDADSTRQEWLASTLWNGDGWAIADPNPVFNGSFLFTLYRSYNEWGYQGWATDTTLFCRMPADSMYQDPIETDLDLDGWPELMLQRDGRYRVFAWTDYAWDDERMEGIEAYTHRIDSVMSRGIGDSTCYRADAGDLTGDGRPDLIVGKRDGTLTFFENRGRDAPDFWRQDTTFFSGIRVKGPAVPALADLDGDGDKDLVVADGDGRLFSFGNDSARIVWAVKDRSVPSGFTLRPNYPNPFNGRTEIRFILQAAEKVRLDVIDVKGRRVRTLVDGRREAGAGMVRWDGTDESRVPVPSGLYLLRLSSPRSAAVRKMTVIR
jgi:hypothetical protein